MNITIIGLGYVGLVTALCLAEKGHHVSCLDIDKEKINQLNQGKFPFYEPGVEDLYKKNAERLTFTFNYGEAFIENDVIMICVGTPDNLDGSANLKYVYNAVEKIAQTVQHDCVVVIKSTVPVGTNDKIAAYIQENKKNNVNIEVVSNPEFLSQGSAVRDTLHASRIVIGVESAEAETVMRKVYENFGIPIVVTDRRSAEMIKYAANDFLALKISYINEIANLCEIVGANIEDVAKGMGMDPRIGDKFLNAGIGYGGSCFPKDTKALHWLANFNDYELKTIKATIEVNENQKLKLVKKARKYYDSFKDLEVAVLGLTFKPGTDDLREAASLVNIPIFLEDGANVRVWDPVGMENFKKHFPYELTYCDSIEDTIRNADLCLIFTEWEPIKQFDINKFVELMKNPIVIDGRNCYSLDQVEGIGLTYESIGRKVIKPKQPVKEIVESPIS
jgi:UDPglucose 6-dehydrogenase